MKKPDIDIADGHLRPADTDDLQFLIELLHNLEVRRYLCDDRALPRESVAELLSTSKELDPRGLGLWIIEQTGSGAVGIVGLQPVSFELADPSVQGERIEPIIALHPGSWGKGIATRAMNTLIQYAGSVLGLDDLLAAVDVPNTRSCALMLRCGFVPAGYANGPANRLMLFRLDVAGNGKQG
ncbi:MAG: GNAT family N-acetyltransferase [Pseudomonadota bacterium]